VRLAARLRGKPSFHDALCAVLARNATLRELCICTSAGQAITTTASEVEALLLAAPQLRALEVDLITCNDAVKTGRALRNEPPFGPLRVRKLLVNGSFSGELLPALMVDMAAHVSLQLDGLAMCGVFFNSPAMLDAVVDAAIARRLSTVELTHCYLFDLHAAPALLARLLEGGALTTLVLDLHCVGAHRFIESVDAAAPLAQALRASTSLTSLCVKFPGGNNTATYSTLLEALTGHARLQKLAMPHRRVFRGSSASGIGAALGALLSANTPALQELDVHDCLRGEEMRPLLNALRHNTHLRTLDCSDNGLSEAKMHRHLLDAVRANTSLRKLVAGSAPSEQAAEALVAARATQPAMPPAADAAADGMPFRFGALRL
jgi:hypothetical protein